MNVQIEEMLEADVCRARKPLPKSKTLNNNLWNIRAGNGADAGMTAQCVSSACTRGCHTHGCG